MRLQILLIPILALLAACGGSTPSGSSSSSNTSSSSDSSASPSNKPLGVVVDKDEAIVVIFIIDGLQADSAATAIAQGANNLKIILEQGVTVETAYSVSPAPRLELPDGTRPWGGTSPPNVAIHTGAHVYDSRDMDDIFLAAREGGVKSVYVGGDKNYAAFDTADFHYASRFSDEEVVALGIKHFKEDDTRLIRLHLQRIRDHFDEPTNKTDPNSDYVNAILEADKQLGVLIDSLTTANVWDKTYIIVAADHGMGKGNNHNADVHTSWEIFMGFYGPGIKKGQTIPYAESPDIAILTAHLLGLRPLKGHTDPNINPKGATGTLLNNIFEGQPTEIEHPRAIERYLQSENYSPPRSYIHHREALLRLLAD